MDAEVITKDDVTEATVEKNFSTKDIFVNKIIVHKVSKKQREKASIKTRDAVLPVQNDPENTTFKFVSGFSSIFRNSTRTSRVFGEFLSDEKNFPLVTYVQSYYNKQKEFVGFSKEVAERFRIVLDRVPMSTGGYIFCIDYTDYSEPSLAIVILTLKTGTSIDDETLELSSNVLLDIDEINMAVNIKLGKWENKEKSYLSFVGGKKGITNYFLDFIGCQQTENSVKVTHFLIDSVLELDEEIHGNDDDYDNRKEEVSKLLYTTLSSNKKNGVHIDSILKLIFDENECKQYYNKYSFDENKIPSSFIPDARAYNKLFRFQFKKKGLDLRIDHDLFKDVNYIAFTEEEGFLLIKDPEIKRAFDESK